MRRIFPKEKHRAFYVLSGVVFDSRPEFRKEAESFIKQWKGDDLISPAVGPHAVYTCSEDTLLWAKEIAEKNDVLLHIHLSETRGEVEAGGKVHIVTVGFPCEQSLAAGAALSNSPLARILAAMKPCRAFALAAAPVVEAQGGEARSGQPARAAAFQPPKFFARVKIIRDDVRPSVGDDLRAFTVVEYERRAPASFRSALA